jgi:hypothetical protein
MAARIANCQRTNNRRQKHKPFFFLPFSFYIPHSLGVSYLFCSFDKRPYLQYPFDMQSVVLNIYDDSKTDALLGLLHDLKYVEVRALAQNPQNDVYSGIPSKLDDDLLQSQLDVLEKADW